MIRAKSLPGDAVIDLLLYAIFFLLIGVIGWRLRQRKGRIDAAADVDGIKRKLTTAPRGTCDRTLRPATLNLIEIQSRTDYLPAQYVTYGERGSVRKRQRTQDRRRQVGERA